MSDDELNVYFSADDSSNNDSFNSLTETHGDQLRQIFFTQSCSLINVCHINAHSVPCHFGDITEFL